MGVFHFISRHATRIIAIGAVFGLFAQPLATIFRPYLGDCVLVMLTVSLLRTDLGALIARVRRPRPAIAGAAFVSLFLPLVVLGGATLYGPPLSDPVVLAVLFLFTVPPPLVSAPAFAFLMGLDGALVLAVMLAAIVAMPLTAPVLASIFVPDTFPVGPVELALRLAALIAVAFTAATVLRRLAGPARIAAARPVLDTISVTIAVVFAIGAMDNVGVTFLAAPLFTVAVGVGSFAFGVAQMAIVYAAFRPFVGTDAVAIAYAGASRNAGLIVAAVGATNIEGTVWLFFALSQLPIFFFPLILKPLGRRLSGAGVPGEGPAGAGRATAPARGSGD